MKIDNLNAIKKILNLTDEGDFYILYVMQRKKDMTKNENNQSERIIKSYVIESIDYLDKKYEEIKKLCEFFTARAYITVQKQNHKDVPLLMISNIAKRMSIKQYNQKHIFESILGELKIYEKRWIVDIDTKNSIKVDSISKWLGEKVIIKLPTKNGYHLITEKFNTADFEKTFPNVEIKKRRNLTLLYLPSSII